MSMKNCCTEPVVLTPSNLPIPFSRKENETRFLPTPFSSMIITCLVALCTICRLSYRWYFIFFSCSLSFSPNISRIKIHLSSLHKWTFDWILTDFLYWKSVSLILFFEHKKYLFYFQKKAIPHRGKIGKKSTSKSGVIHTSTVRSTFTLGILPLRSLSFGFSVRVCQT